MTDDTPKKLMADDTPQEQVNADPLLLMQQQMQKQYQDMNKRIMELKQQSELIAGLVETTNVEAAELRGGLRILARVINTP